MEPRTNQPQSSTVSPGTQLPRRLLAPHPSTGILSPGIHPASAFAIPITTSIVSPGIQLPRPLTLHLAQVLIFSQSWYSPYVCFAYFHNFNTSAVSSGIQLHRPLRIPRAFEEFKRGRMISKRVFNVSSRDSPGKHLSLLCCY
jgi:hypothetical protein